MKRNFRVWLMAWFWAIVAISFFSAAGAIFSRPPQFEDGEKAPVYVSVVSAVFLLMAGFATMFLSHLSTYKMGKGELLTGRDMKQEISRLKGQIMTAKGPVVIIENALNEVRATVLKKPFEEKKLPEYVMPGIIDGVPTLVPADSTKPIPTTEKLEKPINKSRVQSLPKAEVFGAKTNKESPQTNSSPS